MASQGIVHQDCSSRGGCQHWLQLVCARHQHKELIPEPDSAVQHNVHYRFTDKRDTIDELAVWPSGVNKCDNLHRYLFRLRSSHLSLIQSFDR